jgi:hypothetical protein
MRRLVRLGLTEKHRMKIDITQIWTAWKKGYYTPKSERERLILELWEAFLAEGPGDFDNQVNVIPDTLGELWSLANSIYS